MIRLFVGLALPEATRQRLQGLNGGLPGARWTRPENRHLTLRFIGEVDNGLADDIDLALEKVDAAPFEVTLDGVGYFGSARKARTLWVGVAENPALHRLQAKVEAALVGIGLAPEGRKYSPHVTLARLKSPPRDRLDAYVADHAPFRDGPLPLREFILFSSFLSASGV